MKIALYGATGKAGSRILTELLQRGHQVTAVVRDPAKVAPHTGLTVVAGDVESADGIASKIAGADAVVSAYGPPFSDTEKLLGVTQNFLAAVKAAGVPRFLYVGGAASLEVAPGLTLLASGHLPAEWIPIATSHAKAQELVKASDINWTVFSPAAFYEPGVRTGTFRIGKDQLIADATGKSWISMEDSAIAIADELENPKFERARFTAGY